MPHSAVKLVPGVDTNETPALNQAGISSCQLIRFVYDKGGLGLVQKLGGWTKFFPNTIVAKVRALWAWEDTEDTAHLAVGTENIGSTFQAQLGVITDGVLSDITPRYEIDNISPAVVSVAGNSILTITDTTITNISAYDSVYIPAHISIGALILFGLYQTDPDGDVGVDTYTIQSLDALGNPLAAPSSASGGSVASFATTSGFSTVTVTLDNHGYVAGSAYPVLVPTTVGGIEFYGNYIVNSVVDANNFVIIGTNNASATTTGSINGGLARYIYSFGVGATAIGTGFGVGGFGRGGFGTGTNIIPATGSPIQAVDWTLDNWGEILIACPSTKPVALTTTSASGDGTTGTLNFSQTYTVDVGETITVADVSPPSWNGTYVVAGSTSSSVSFATAVTAAQTAPGAITVDSTPFEPIYQWDPEGGAPTATVIPQAPPVNEGVFVAMPQRQIIAYGSTETGIQDPLLVRWCDIENFNVWIGQITNQAGSYRLARGSKIVGGLQGPQQGILWTDLGVWSMQYINQPYVYSFNEIGSGCGLIAKKAAGILNDVIYWMGPSQFFLLGADGVQTIPCSVWDVIFQDLDQNNLDKIRIAVNSRFNEVAWYYPTLSSNGEVAAYVKFNALFNEWDYGALARSAWIDQSVLGPPIGADPNALYIYQHETSPDADGQAMLPSFTTGYFAIEDGDYKVFVDQVWPDLKFGYFGGMQNATVTLNFHAADYPGQPPTVYGPFQMTQGTTFLTPRIRTRLLAISLSSSDVGSFWRIGLMRYRYAPDGKF